MWKKHVGVAAAVLALAMAYSATAGQLGYWAFDDGSGTTARDSSGKNNHGRLVGGPTWVNGKLGKALQFDGVDDYVEVSHNANLIPTTGKATVSVWINAKRHTGPGGSEWQGILAKGSWDPRLYNLYTHASESLHFSTGPGSNTIGTLSTGKVPLNEWVHIAVAVDGRHLYYINGEPAGVDGEGATVPAAGSAPLTIGQTGESNFFLGMIDEVRIYDVALTSAEVKDLFNGNPPSWPKAQKPTPTDGQLGVDMGLLSWTPGDGALFHEVWVGTDPEALVKVSFPNWTYTYWYYSQPLVPETTYYWRVDEVTATGTLTPGDVWSFTVVPTNAYAPSPADGAKYVARDAKLSWAVGRGAITHDVYFGTSRDDVAAGTGDTRKPNQYETTFDPGPLAGDTVYYWRVDEVDSKGAKVTGKIWQFRTRPVIPISDPNLVGWWELDEGEGTFVLDSSGRDNHGALQNDPCWVDGIIGGALQFDGVDDYVEVPHAETLTAASEVSVMAWINAERLAGPGGVEWQGILAKGNSPRSYSFYTTSSGVLHFSAAGGGGTSTGTVPLNEWVHVAVAAGSTQHTYFINGESAGQGGPATPPGAQDAATVRIGTTHEGQRQFLGMIDEVRIYNRALTQDEVKVAMQGDPLRARDPQPARGAEVDIRAVGDLSWTAGETAASHEVYFGTDKDAVGAADPNSPEYLGRQAGTSYPLAGLVEFGGGAYAWRVDEVETDGATIHKGSLWTFTVPGYLIVDNFESYDDNVDAKTTIYDTWIDGLTNGNGSMVGYWDPPFAERTIVHSGRQSMPLEYNNVDTPFYSEAEREFAPQENWTLYDVNHLVVWFRGQPVRFQDNAGVITMSGSGHDIWDNADDFRYAYKRLSGNGSIIARVESLVNTNDWAKAGVMIRESLDPGSTFAYAIVSATQGVSFGWRPLAGGTCDSRTQAGLAAPQYVKLTRTSNVFTAQYSADGAAWTEVKNSDGTVASTTIAMTGSIYIGLCVTSHDAAATTTAVFSSVTPSAGISGDWRVSEIGDDPEPANDPQGLYVRVTDGTTARRNVTVRHPDPAATIVTAWTEWKIPLSSLAGVSLNKVSALCIGVGDKVSPAQDGFGRIFIDDIRVAGPPAAK